VAGFGFAKCKCTKRARTLDGSLLCSCEFAQPYDDAVPIGLLGWLADQRGKVALRALFGNLWARLAFGLAEPTLWTRANPAAVAVGRSRRLRPTLLEAKPEFARAQLIVGGRVACCAFGARPSVEYAG
jgi:hypothetical protein